MINDFVTAKALLDKTQLFANAQGYRLAIQDASFEPVPTEIYLKETYMGNDTDPLGLSGSSSDRQDPIYQIDVLTPKGQGGKFSGMAIANLLKAEFPRASFIVNNVDQKVKISNVNSRPMPSNKTHNWTMIEVDLVVMASN